MALPPSAFPFFDASTSTTTPSKPSSTSAVPTRLSPGSMFSFSPPPRQSSSTSVNSKVLHRHSAAVERALHQLRTLSAQTEGVFDKGKARDEGIIKNLEDQGWAFQTSTDGIRIFSKESDADEARTSAGLDAQREGTFVSVKSNGAGAGPSRARSGKRQVGVRRGEDLPWFRGEGWIDGNWRLEDIAATLTSVGARTVWDPRFDPMRSGVVALLSPTDQLWGMHIRAELGADRDACLVSTIELDPEKQVCFVASTSVLDPLIPVHGTRTNIHLNGYCLRALPRAPYFEPPPARQSSESAPTPSRPGHRRAKSSMSFKNKDGGAPLSPSYAAPPLPAIADSGFPFQPRTPFAGPARPLSPTLDGGEDDGDSEVNPFDLPQFAPLPAKPKPTPMLDPAPSTRPGLHVSLIVHVSPGFNLPQTTVNQLSLHLPLSIAAINRYLVVHGFSPYIVKRPREEGLDILDERFDAMAATYRVLYRKTSVEGETETRIRFFGGTFAKGRFDIEVEGGAEGWRLEYDVEPDVKPETRRSNNDDKEEHVDDDGLLSSGLPRPSLPTRASRKSSLSVLASPTLGAPPRLQPSLFSSLNGSARGDNDDDAPSRPSSPPPIDPARLPGPLGGCTLFIPNDPATLHLPISVSITKNSLAVSRPLARMKRMSRALGRAVRTSGAASASQYDTVEEMLERSSGDGRAEMCLRGARESLKEMRRAKEEEERDDDLENEARELAEEVGRQGGKSVAFVASPSDVTEGELDGTGSEEVGEGKAMRKVRRRSSASMSLGLGLEGIEEGDH